MLYGLSDKIPARATELLRNAYEKRVFITPQEHRPILPVNSIAAITVQGLGFKQNYNYLVTDSSGSTVYSSYKVVSETLIALVLTVSPQHVQGPVILSIADDTRFQFHACIGVLGSHR